jgi:U4/U6.U5 tri-snRNP-associated protein 3
VIRDGAVVVLEVLHDEQIPTGVVRALHAFSSRCSNISTDRRDYDRDDRRDYGRDDRRDRDRQDDRKRDSDRPRDYPPRDSNRDRDSYRDRPRDVEPRHERRPDRDDSAGRFMFQLLLFILSHPAPSTSEPTPKPSGSTGSNADDGEEGEDMDAMGGEEADMMAMMGIAGFGTTKVNF